MREPKYKLNQRDERRYHELLTRHCMEAQFIRPGVPNKPNPKYPPLTQSENREFERLHEKQRRKVESHPKMKKYLAHQKKLVRQSNRILNRCKAEINRLILGRCRGCGFKISKDSEWCGECLCEHDCP